MMICIYIIYTHLSIDLHDSSETQKIFFVPVELFSYWLIGGLGWWFGFRKESPYERDCYLGVSLESQTTGPQTTNWLIGRIKQLEKHVFW